MTGRTAAGNINVGAVKPIRKPAWKVAMALSYYERNRRNPDKFHGRIDRRRVIRISRSRGTRLPESGSKMFQTACDFISDLGNLLPEINRDVPTAYAIRDTFFGNARR